ncbi:MAG TPA: SpoIIE family protein phosphatase [Thermoleophilaceae bacterium]|jgi:PAS domain S-box-containing protein
MSAAPGVRGETRTSVLIVDDKPQNLIALDAVLRPLELDVVSAESGEEALKLLLDRDYAAILLDVQMPGMDGFETAEFIKRRERTAHIPIIFLTAIDKERQKVFRGYQVGAVDYVFKPYDPDVLRSKVATFVELYRKTAALRASEERFRAAFANAPIGIGLMGPDGNWIQANAALCELVGHPQHEFLSKPLWELAVPDDRKRDREEMRGALDARVGAFESERRLRHADGSTVHVLVSASLASAQEDGAPTWVVQLVDLTERKRAERERAEREHERAARAEAEAVADTIQRIQRVSDVALAHLELGDLVRALVELLREIVVVDAAAILLMEANDSRLRLVGGAGLSNLPERDLLIPIGEGFAGRVAVAGTAEAGAPVPRDGGLETVLAAAGMRSALVVPMSVEGRVSGAIAVARRSAAPFPEGDHRLLQLIADRAALAIEHARLYQRELGIVEVLQRSLLPERLPRLPGVDLAARYMPGGVGADVGGDWYDAIPLAGGRIGMALGDVVGHGIGAAALMGQLRNALRAYALDGHSPSEVVSRLDRLVQRLEHGRMATLLFMVFEPDLGTVHFSSAGHLPPLVVEPDGSARYLDGGRTPPLGVMPLAEHLDATAEIPAGSTLVLYSDGLVEERGVGLDRGLATLSRATVEGPDDPEALCDHIIESLFEERSPNDDVAVLVLRTVALHGNRLELELTADPDAQRTMRRTVGRWLDRAGVVPEQTNEVQVACHEVCSNAIEHGHRFGDDVVRIEAEIDGDVLAMTVVDTGTWREERVTDRGRGLSMARAFMDTVDVETGPEGTRVSMTRRLTFVARDGEGSAGDGSAGNGAKKKKPAARRKRAASGPARSR